jgi:hypothetical protein
MPYLLAWCCKSTKKVLFAKAFSLKNEETFFAFERMEAFFSVAHMAKRVFTADSPPFIPLITVDLTRFCTAHRPFFRTGSAFLPEFGLSISSKNNPTD